jgi:hypothetical protein
MLPSALGAQRLGNRQVVALVYAFQRTRGEPQRPWTEGAPSALVHLQKSGIGKGLGL